MCFLLLLLLLLFTAVGPPLHTEIMIGIKLDKLFHCRATVISLGWVHAPIKANEIWRAIFWVFWQKEESFTGTIRIGFFLPPLPQPTMLSNSSFKSAVAFHWQETTMWRKGPVLQSAERGGSQVLMALFDLLDQALPAVASFSSVRQSGHFIVIVCLSFLLLETYLELLSASCPHSTHYLLFPSQKKLSFSDAPSSCSPYDLEESHQLQERIWLD